MPLNTVETTAQQGNYFSRHMAGQLPLRTTFWVNVAGLSALMCFVISWASRYFDRYPLAPRPLLLFSVIAAPVFFIVVFWQISGLWKAASKLSGSARYSEQISAKAAQFIAALGLLFLANHIIVFFFGLTSLYQKAFVPRSYDECVQTNLDDWRGEISEIETKTECISAFPPKFDWNQMAHQHGETVGKNTDTWATISNSDTYKALGVSDRQAVKEDYWNRVLKPQIRLDFVEFAHNQFMKTL